MDIQERSMAQHGPSMAQHDPSMAQHGLQHGPAPTTPGHSLSRPSMADQLKLTIITRFEEVRSWILRTPAWLSMLLACTSMGQHGPQHDPAWPQHDPKPSASMPGHTRASLYHGPACGKATIEGSYMC